MQRGGVSTQGRRKPWKEAKVSQKLKFDRSHVNIVNGVESSNDEMANVYTAEWAWSSTSKPFVFSTLKLVGHKNRQEEVKFTFDMAKCDRIFDYLLENKQIKLSQGHVILSLRN